MNDRDKLIEVRDQLTGIAAGINAHLADHGDPVPPGPTPPSESCSVFVTRMYAQYAHTTPDAGGYAYWVGHCADGSMSRSEIEAAFAAAYPPAPAPPLPPPGGSCSGPNDLSDTAMHAPIQFHEGQYQTFCFRSNGGNANLTGVAVAGTAAKTAWFSVDGGTEDSFTPSGSDFRFIPINGPVSAGVHTCRVKITGIVGAGQFGLQAQGTGVGP